MQKLIIVSGSPCVGKSAASDLLYQAYQNSAYLDGDWCWYVNPFSVEDPRLRGIQADGYKVIGFTLTCTEETLRQRR